MSTKEAERLQELRLLLQSFSDRGPSVVRSLQVMEEAAHMRVMPVDISSRAKRTARQAVEHPPSSHSSGEGDTKLAKGPTGLLGIDADGSTSGLPGINAGGPIGLQYDNGKGSSCSSSRSLVSHPPLPQPPPPPPGLGIHYFVISLRDSIGEERLSNMNLFVKYTVIDGVRPDDVPAHISAHWHSGRMSLERNRALQGAFAAHVRAWEAILAAGDDGFIVLEDDCISYRQHPISPAQYPIDAITLLGGCFRGFGNSGMCETSYIDGAKVLDTIVHLPRGVHEIPVQNIGRTRPDRQMRWAMCVAYYVPPGMAAQLLDVVWSAKKKHMFKSPDIFLAPFTKYFLWPPAFGDQGKQSLCFTHKEDLGTDLYCSAGMREVAASLSRPLPPLGCSTVDLLEWQLLQSMQLFKNAQSSQTGKAGV